MARIKGESIFPALFSLVNEMEEIRTQAFALTKGFSILPGVFEGVSNGLKEHGHPATSIYACDNPVCKHIFLYTIIIADTCLSQRNDHFMRGSPHLWLGMSGIRFLIPTRTFLSSSEIRLSKPSFMKAPLELLLHATRSSILFKPFPVMNVLPLLSP